MCVCVCACVWVYIYIYIYALVDYFQICDFSLCFFHGIFFQNISLCNFFFICKLFYLGFFKLSELLNCYTINYTHTHTHTHTHIYIYIYNKKHKCKWEKYAREKVLNVNTVEQGYKLDFKFHVMWSIIRRKRNGRLVFIFLHFYLFKFLSNSISTFVGYLIPKPSLQKSGGTN